MPDRSYTETTGVSQAGLAHLNDSKYNQVTTGKRCGEAANEAAAAPPQATAPAATSRKASRRN